MSQLNGTQFTATYEDSVAGTFLTNTTQAIGSDDMRQFASDINDSFLNLSDHLVTSGAITGSQANTNNNITPNAYLVGAYQVTSTIESSAILTGNSSPVTIVPAQGLGMVIVPIMFFVHLDYSSAAYATNTTFRFEINGVAVTGTNTTILPGTADRYTTILPIAYDTTTDFKNKALNFEVQTGDPTAGDSPIVVTCVYRSFPTTPIV